jgi:hypothetical protein
VSGRDRPVPPNTDEMFWNRFLAELDAIEETIHPLGTDEGALAEVVELARRPLDLGDDDGGEPPPKLSKRPPPKPRRRAAKSDARKKIVRMPNTFAKPKPVRLPRTRRRPRERLVIYPQEQRALTASGERAAGLWEWYLQRELAAATQARERRALTAAALPSAVLPPTTLTSANGTVVVTTTIETR